MDDEDYITDYGDDDDDEEQPHEIMTRINDMTDGFVFELYNTEYWHKDLYFVMIKQFDEPYCTYEELLKHYLNKFTYKIPKKYLKLACTEKMFDDYRPMIFREHMTSCKLNLEKPDCCPICLNQDIDEWIQVIHCGHRVCINCATMLSNINCRYYPVGNCCMCRENLELYTNLRIETNFDYKNNIKWTVTTNMIMIFRNTFTCEIDETKYKRSSLYYFPSAVINIGDYCMIYCNQSLDNAIENCYQKFLETNNQNVYTIYVVQTVNNNNMYHEIFLNFLTNEISTGYYTIGHLNRNLATSEKWCTGYGGYFFTNFV